MAGRRTITIIGGGVIGLTAAYTLVREGHEITLIERGEDIGQEASFANGGQLSYRYVSPLADAGVTRDALGWLLRPHSPIALRLRADPGQWRWLLAFLLACNRRTNRENAAILLDLALSGQTELQVWRNAGLEDFLWRRPGKLVLYRTASIFRKAARSITDPARQRALSPTECVAVEPAFAGLQPRLAGGLFSPEDEVGDCFLFCKALRKALAAQPGFRLVRGTAGLTPGMGGRCTVSVDGQPFETDLVILAAGLASRALGRPLGLDLPLYGLKGYSLTTRPQPGILPSVSVTDYDNRVVYAGLGDRLRVAAMVDIGTEETTPDPRRLADLRALVAATLPGALGQGEDAPWAGLRPATPTGVPIIARTRYDNLLLNVGHGALGFTLSVGSALRLKEIVAGADDRAIG
ncbi:D-amino acid dehydrogenase 2 [Gluconacetobacter liquefaciens]|uniref:D-amino-acid dehydrogenase n=1 Tax=Gluconacetobacter liquefaciens TaxID=89584 RepID=A0A370G9I4_GLULI|nr:FAD-dependent oxidoreductase [Gluconacetobacter liquefaciens]MBB2184946.1 FAD-dependent oxidoreductase [Gluconacetobacter liquefaciens]RDI40371.1 D-amino-acid dehydrogenase [Gluconacetobacter liquefaciens]GBR04794.1 D-amino acid dehydrogenase small subunit [Gluconacetobacter liquefaciens NRIC 0522]GEB37303.1 D-amino acid dehydrogenase 2 [Gluconacetobacter liquefaciens]